MAHVDQKKFHEFLKSKIKRPRCHICRKGPIYYTSKLYIIEEWSHLPGVEKKPVIGVVPLNCKNCGAVSFIDPYQMGFDVLPDDEDFDNEIMYL